jgi:hypothetical protein
MGITIDKSNGGFEVTTGKGIVPPKMTNAEILAIVDPIEGAQIYDTDNNILVVLDGAGGYAEASAETYWDRTITTLSPSNAGDIVDLDTGYFNGRKYVSAFDDTGGIELGTNGLLHAFAQYHLNENGAGAIVDSSGNVYNGTLTGSPTWDSSTQKLGASALSFTGSSQYILMDSVAASTFDFEFTDAFSFDMWVRVDAIAGTSRVLLSKGTTSAGYKLAILANGNPELELNCNGVTRKLLKEGVFNFESSIGTWHHLVATYDGSETVAGLKLYVDNVLLATANSTETYTPGDTLITTQYLQLSGVNENNNIATNITLDEVVIFNEELSVAEIESRWNSGSGDENIGLDGNIFNVRNDFSNDLVKMGFGVDTNLFEFEKAGNLNIKGGNLNITDIENNIGIALGPNDAPAPYAHFHFNEADLSYVYDSSGNGYAGLLYNGITYDTSTQKLGDAAIEFSSGQYILFEEGPSTDFGFEFDDSFSFEMWIRVDAVSASTRTLISKGNANDGYKLDIMANGNPRLTLNSTNSAELVWNEGTFNFESSIGTWHHLVVTYDGSEDVGGIKFYVDNTLLVTADGNLSTGPGDTLIHGNYFEISGQNEGSDTAHDITLDELVVYAKELTTSEIAARWNSGSGSEDIDYYENIFSITNDLSNDKLSLGFTRDTNAFEFNMNGNLTITDGALELSTTKVPVDTTDKLYKYYSTLYWNGQNLLGPGTRSVISRSSGPYTASINYDVLITCSTVDITVNLPTAVGNRGKTILVSKRDATANNVIVDAFDTQTINGSFTHTISTQYESVEFTSDGGNWYTRN